MQKQRDVEELAKQQEELLGIKPPSIFAQRNNLSNPISILKETVIERPSSAKDVVAPILSANSTGGFPIAKHRSFAANKPKVSSSSEKIARVSEFRQFQGDDLHREIHDENLR